MSAERFRSIGDREVVIALWLDDGGLPARPVLEVREACTGRLLRIEPASGRQVADAYPVRELLGMGEFADGAGTVVAFVAGEDVTPEEGTLSVARSWSGLRGEPRPWPRGGLRIIRNR